MVKTEQSTLKRRANSRTDAPTPHGAKVKQGQLSAVQQGRYGTGPAPYGYRRGGNGGNDQHDTQGFACTAQVDTHKQGLERGIDQGPVPAK